MKTIKEDIINEIVINKSRFITVLCGVGSDLEVKEKMNFYKEKYKGATHYCYGYIIDSYMKCDDDGEPSGTAGMPILNVLKNKGLEHVLCIVIRYFGGIKLGAGGLVRAYSRCSSEAIGKAVIASLVDGYYLEISFNYDDIKVIDRCLKDIDVLKKFDDKVYYSFKISVLNYEKMENVFNEKCHIIKKEPIVLTV